jgi:hypothetical protein
MDDTVLGGGREDRWRASKQIKRTSSPPDSPSGCPMLCVDPECSPRRVPLGSHADAHGVPSVRSNGRVATHAAGVEVERHAFFIAVQDLLQVPVCKEDPSFQKGMRRAPSQSLHSAVCRRGVGGKGACR